MNALPLPKVQCGPAIRKHPTVVFGTSNAPMGCRLRERSNCRIKPESIFERHEENPQHKEYEAFLRTWRFEKESDRKIKKKRTWQRVQQGMAAYEDTVNQRREKLRELLLQEEIGLTREVVYQSQHGDDARMDEMRQRIAEIRKDQEDKRLALVAAKRMQQYLASCPELRSKISKKTVLEVKRSNVVQMAENQAKKQSEKELDNLWHELSLREIEVKKQKEAEDPKKHVLAQETMAILAKQVAAKRALEEHKKQVQKEDREYLERLWETVRQEELKKLEAERENREKLKKELQDQIMSTKKRLAEHARKEVEMELMLKALAEKEAAKKKEEVKNLAETLRKELLVYLQYLEDLRKEEARRNLEVDAIFEQSLKDRDARLSLAKKKHNEARARGLQEVIRGREKQIKCKIEKEQKELETQQMERLMIDKDMELDAIRTVQLRKEAKERALSYKKDLEEQLKCIDDARRREAEREKRILEEESKREEEYQSLTKELLEASENITPHPFKVLLKECAARYAAENKGECYCPPPLKPEELANV